MGITEYYFSGDFKEFESLFSGPDFMVVKYNAGSVLCREGDYGKKIFYILEGNINALVLDESGKQYVFFIQCSGSMIPVTCHSNISLLIDMPIILETKSGCKVIEFEPKVLREIIMKHPKVGVRCVEHYYKEENLLVFQTISFSTKHSERRICDVIYILYMSNKLTKNDDTIYYSQDEFAEMIGITRMQITRIFQDLRENGIIKTSRHKVTLLDKDKLLARCSNSVNNKKP